MPRLNLQAISGSGAGPSVTRAFRELDLRLNEVESLFARYIKNASIVASHADLRDLSYASSGHTGFASSAQLTAHTGNTSNPHTTTLEQAITAGGTATTQPVFNGGIDLGTSGRFDSNVENAAGAASFLFQPTVDLTDGTDRYTARWNNSGGTSQMTMFANGQVEWNGLTGSNTGFLQVSGTIPSGPYLGINFAPTTFTSSGTIGPFTTCVGGALFQATVGGTSTLSQVGGYFKTVQSTTGNVATSFAGLFEVGRNGNNTSTTAIGCIYLRDVSNQSKGGLTNWYGIYCGAIGGLPTGANRTWLYIPEITSGTANNNEIFIGGGGEIFFRDQAIHVGSLTDGHLDLTADTSIDMNGDVDMSTVDIITDTTTGTKVGTGTTQKLGFWNATPIVQPATGGAASTFAANTSGISDDSATWDGYTIGNVVKALRNMGLLA